MRLACTRYFLLLPNGISTLFSHKEISANENRHGLVPRDLITIPSDYKDVVEDHEEYTRPQESGTLYEADHHQTNGEID